MLMDGLFLDNDFRTPFPYFIVSIAGVFVTGFVFLLLFYSYFALLLLLLLSLLLFYIH